MQRRCDLDESEDVQIDSPPISEPNLIRQESLLATGDDSLCDGWRLAPKSRGMAGVRIGNAEREHSSAIMNSQEEKG